jgi:hypothetical protein
MNIIWNWAEKQPTTEEIYNEKLLSLDNWRRVVCQFAAYGGEEDAMHKIYEWAKEKPATEEIKHEMLFREDNE